MDIVKASTGRMAYLLRKLLFYKPTKTIKRTHRKISRNERCRCGCDKKYKACHWSADVRNEIR